MLAVKGIYDNGHIKLTEPFEPVKIEEPTQIVVLFLNEILSKPQTDNTIPEESMAMMRLTDETAFVQDVINSKEEDCWNEL